MGRSGEIDAGHLPMLPLVADETGGGMAVAVLAKKGDWVKVAIDEAGRERWLRIKRGWQFLYWEDFLSQRCVSLYPGLRRSFNFLHRQPDAEGGEQETINSRDVLCVKGARGEFLLVEKQGGGDGWLRWRDDDGKLLVNPTSPKKD